MAMELPAIASRGTQVGDYDAWANLVEPQQVAADTLEAAALGLHAGLDQEGTDGRDDTPVAQIPAAVASGALEPALVRTAFKRLLGARLRLGLFDPPQHVSANNLTFGECQSDAHIELAREVARAGLVLLHNRAAALPLDVAALRSRAGARVAVVGPLATDGEVLLGNYALPSATGRDVSSSLLEGVRQGLGAGVSVSFAPGCDDAACDDPSGFAAAARLAASANATIVLLGTRGTWGDGCTEQSCEDEAHDRTSLELPPNQYALASALASALAARRGLPTASAASAASAAPAAPAASAAASASSARAGTGAPLVCVLLHGGPIALRSLIDDCDALLAVGYPGSQGARAIADVLTGVVSPSGRLPVTWYEGDAPLARAMGNMDLRDAQLTYRFAPASAVALPFGYGQSYTSFAYSALAAPSSAAPCEPFGVNVTLTNTGAVAAHEVAQLYVTLADEPSAPRQQLSDFARVALQPGESLVVTLTAPPRWRALVTPTDAFYKPTRTVPKGRVRLSIGGVSPGFAHLPGVAASVEATVLITEAASLDSCGGASY